MQWRNSALINGGGGDDIPARCRQFWGGYKLLYPTLLSLGWTISPCPPQKKIAPMGKCLYRVDYDHFQCYGPEEVIRRAKEIDDDFTKFSNNDKDNDL